MITMVADRESDIYDLFARRPGNVHLLCRSMHNRRLTDGTPLAECCASWQEQSRYTVDVPVRGTQPARQATVRLRFGTVSLRRPDSAAEDRADALTLSVVDVKEIAPPAGQEPVRWRLLTTHQVGSVEQARQIVAWYRRRWTIDIDQAWRLSRISGVAVGWCKRRRPAVPRSRRCPDGLQCDDRRRVGLHQLGTTNAGLHHAAA